MHDGPRIVEVSRARVARNALRFGFLGAMLMYAFLPAMFSSPEEDLLGLRTIQPGPWAGAAAGLTAVLGGILYAAGPVWRSTFQPPGWLVDVHFYAAAVGAILVFLALMMGTWQAGAAVAAGQGILEAESRTGAYRPAMTFGGLLMLGSSALFLVNLALAVRSHRSVRRPPKSAASDTGPGSP